MKSLKSAARRGAILSATAISALALASCSAGQVSQTASQQDAVDGNFASNKDGAVDVADVQIVVDPNSKDSALKFVLNNNGYQHKDVTLESIAVDGQKVGMKDVEPIGRGGSIVGDSAAGLKANKLDKEHNQYTATHLDYDDYGFGGSRKVTFKLSTGDLTVDAPIAAPQFKTGSHDRDPASSKRFSSNNG